jgi:hypothetical protein
VVAVALQIGVLVGLPGEVPPDEVLAVALDDGGDGSAGEVLALGAAVDDVASGETASRSESWNSSGRPSTMKSTKSRWTW